MTKIVEVPDYVVDWYNSNAHELNNNIICLSQNISNKPEERRDKFEQWFMTEYNSIGILISMRDNGYVVKTERYFLQNKLTRMYLYKLNNDEYMEVNYKENATAFTEDEINEEDFCGYYKDKVK